MLFLRDIVNKWTVEIKKSALNVIAASNIITLSDIPLEINHNQGHPISPFESSAIPDKSSTGKIKLNRDGLLKVLTESDWNKAEVGRRVGLSRASIWKYMKKWDIPTARPEGK